MIILELKSNIYVLCKVNTILPNIIKVIPVPNKYTVKDLIGTSVNNYVLLIHPNVLD